MSDDEEVIIGKSDLYNHLIEQGYSDFESFRPTQPDCQYLPKNELLNIPSFNSLRISSHDHQNILSILNSHLLLKDDVDVVEGLVSNITVEQTKSKVYLFVCPAVSSLLSYALCNKRYLFYASVGITCLITGYSSWKGYKQIVAINENKLFLSHLGTLQKLCLNIHKMLRFIRETEIISTREVPFHNIGSFVYNSLHLFDNKSIDPSDNTSPSWKTLPHLRKYFVNSLEKVLHLFSFTCDTFNSCSPVISEMSKKFSLKNDEALNERQYLLKDLQTLVDNYLALQSEYLRWLALSFAPPVVANTVGFKKKPKEEIRKIIFDIQSEISYIYVGLSMQYNIHKIPANLIEPSHSKTTESLDSENINKLQIEIHNIFLLMLSLLLRIRSLEDDLVIGSLDHSTKALNPTNKLSVIRDDFLSVLKCYDIICQNIIAKKNTEAHDQPTLGFSSSIDSSETAVKTTGIKVGTSDFTVNSPDEVFLAITGLKSDPQEDYLDDWSLESKPQIPKNLLRELANTLKHRKKHFSEREKQALERKGLHDIESDSDVSDIENHKEKPAREHFIRRSYKTIVSDSEDEYKQSLSSDKLNDCNKSELDDSDDSQFENTNNSRVMCMGNNQLTPNLSSSSVANLAAIKSQLWNKMVEEHFSDSSEEC